MDLFRRNDNPAYLKMIASSVEEVGLPGWLPMGSPGMGIHLAGA